MNKYIYDMRRCGGMYKVYTGKNGYVDIADTSGTIEITIPSDGTLYVGVKSSTNVAHGGYNIACFDGDYIKIKKAR